MTLASCLQFPFTAMSSSLAHVPTTPAAPTRSNKNHTPTRPTISTNTRDPAPVTALLSSPIKLTAPLAAPPAANTISTQIGSHTVPDPTPRASKAKAQPEQRRRHPKHGMCSFCHETDSPLWRKGPEQYPHLCNRCGMRYFRYKKQDPPKDPFAQQIYDEIALKRKVRGSSNSHCQ